jgi:hypothetical protein
MSGVIEQWLGASRHTVSRLEDEVSEHQVAIQEAMAAIRAHTEYIHHLQHHLEIIRQATGDVHEGMGISDIEHSFSAALHAEYDELGSAAIETSDGIPIETELVDSNAHSAPVLPMTRRHATDEATGTHGERPMRRPPPPPGYARAARR